MKSNVWWKISKDFYLRNHLLSETKYFESQDHKFSHISEMIISFIADSRNMTYEHYIKKAKPMIEWKFNLLLAENPNLARIFENSTHPLIRKYGRINYNDDEEN